MMEVSFHRLAELELNEAAAYYEFQKAGLGAIFLKEIERCVAGIFSNPEAGVLLSESVRRRLVRRFPYAILHTVRSHAVRILTIMNLRRRPLYWIGRS